MTELLLDAAGRRRSPATLPGFHAGRPPRNKGVRYPADPPTVEEIVAVMRAAGERAHGHRLRGLIVALWRAGLRIHEALALTEADLDHRHGSLLVRRGKGGRRREVGMDAWAWEQLQPWVAVRIELPIGPLFCVMNGTTRGRPGSSAAARAELRRAAARAGVRRRFAPHQLRHAHAALRGRWRRPAPGCVPRRLRCHSSNSGDRRPQHADVYPDDPAPRESAAVASARAVRSMAVKRSDHERIARCERAAAVGTGTPASASPPRRRYSQA